MRERERGGERSERTECCYSGQVVGVAGRQLEVECLGYGGNPPPHITWHKQHKLQPAGSAALDSFTDMETGLVVTRSTLRLNITRQDHNKVLSCEVLHPALGLPLWVKSMINVGCMYHHPPHHAPLPPSVWLVMVSSAGCSPGTAWQQSWTFSSSDTITGQAALQHSHMTSRDIMRDNQRDNHFKILLRLLSAPLLRVRSRLGRRA